MSFFYTRATRTPNLIFENEILISTTVLVVCCKYIHLGDGKKPKMTPRLPQPRIYIKCFISEKLYSPKFINKRKILKEYYQKIHIDPLCEYYQKTETHSCLKLRHCHFNPSMSTIRTKTFSCLKLRQCPFPLILRILYDWPGAKLYTKCMGLFSTMSLIRTYWC